MTIAVIAILFAVLVAIGMPISFAIGVAAMFGTLVLPDVDNATIVQRMLTSVNTFPLLAVIFFIFAGQLMARGGVAMRLVRLAEVLVGRLPGGLVHIVRRGLDVLRRGHGLGRGRGLLDRQHRDPGHGAGGLHTGGS